MNFNVRQIEVFRAVMVAGSISGAARYLSVSQPAISRLLAHTEDRLKIKLFDRIRGRVQPTAEARRLFAEVERVHEAITRVNGLAEELQRGVSKVVRVASSPSVGEMLVPMAIAAFRHRFADIRVEFDSLTLPDLVARLNSGQTDIGISALHVHEPTLLASPLANARLVVICRREHPLAAQNFARAGDLAPFPLIAYGSQTPFGLIVDRFMAQSPKPLNVTTQVRFVPAACSLVQASAGIAIVDELVLMSRTWPDLVAVPLIPKTTLRVNVLTLRSEPVSSVSRSFIAALRQQVPATAALKGSAGSERP